MTWKKGAGYLYVDNMVGKKLEGVGSSFNKPMSARGTFVLGQEQDCDGGCFDHEQAFQGRINRLNVYDAYMTMEECQIAGQVGQQSRRRVAGTSRGDCRPAPPARRPTSDRTPRWRAGEFCARHGSVRVRDVGRAMVPNGADPVSLSL